MTGNRILSLLFVSRRIRERKRYSTPGNTGVEFLLIRHLSSEAAAWSRGAPQRCQFPCRSRWKSTSSRPTFELLF
jgi:hypothetical protein